MRGDRERAKDRTASTTLLEQHRRDIEALDRRILHLVCERLELARQIGDLKRNCGVPLRNFEVEEQVHRRLERASEDLGLEGDLGRELALFLIAKAVEEQATLMDTDYRGDQLRTLVIGGKGGMGSWIGGRNQFTPLASVEEYNPGFMNIEEKGKLPTTWGEIKSD